MIDRKAKLVFLAAVLPVLASAQPAPSTPQTPAPMPPAVVPAPQLGTPQAVVPAPADEERRASRIIGANVVNEENRPVGEVHDLMVSQGSRPVTAVLSVGGFLGLGERYVAVPLSSLQWDVDRTRWVLPGATADSLNALPAFSYPERG